MRTRREAIDDFAVAIISYAMVALWRGWALMLVVDIANTVWVPGLPGLGYWWAVLLMWLFPIAASAGRRGDRA